MSKITFLFSFLLILFSNQYYSQAKKPTLMILPSDNWCEQRYFMTTFDNQATKQKTPDYKKAFQEDTEIGQVISKIGSSFTKDFPLKDAEQLIKNIEARAAEDNMTQNKKTGSYIAESQYDKLRKKAKADIILQIWWKVETTSRGKIVSFVLDGLDAYTGKRIASSSGFSEPNTTDIVPVILEKTILKHIEPFKAQLQNHFDDMFTNGREIIITVKRWDNWDKTLEDEVNGKSIIDNVNDWMHKNTFKDRFEMSDATEDEILFEQVRIPLFNIENYAIDAREFTKQLQDYLKAAPFGFDVKLMTRGLGEAILVIGEK
jgi:hypothetical protein